MSKQSIRGVDTVAASEESVADYLQNHPDFFERNANVLARLRVPHERGVSTVSLVERQVLVLRDKHQKLEAKVREFVAVLKETLTVPLRLWDERLTSTQANRLLIAGNVRRGDRKEKVDKMAAAILLQSYLDSLTL